MGARAAASGAAPGPSLAGSSAALFAAQVVGNAGMFVAVLLVARALAPAGRGTVAFLTVTALVVARIAGIGLSRATTVFAAQRPGDRPALLANLLLLTAACSLLAGALVAAVLLALGDARPASTTDAGVLLLIPGTLAAGLIEAGYGFLQGCGRFRQWALITATMPWLYAALIGGAWLAGDLTATRAVLLWVVGQGAWALVLLVASGRGVGLDRPSRRLVRESVRFGLRAWAGGLASFLNFRTDQILLGALASASSLGVYAVAVNASEVLLYLPAAIATALVPAIAASEPALRVERTLRVFRSLLLVTALAVALAAPAGPVLVPFVFGSAYDGSVEPFLWLLPGALGFAASGVFSSALLASGAPGLSSLGPTVSLVVGVALDLVLIPALGAPGAAIAASVAFLAGGLAALVAFRSAEPFPLGSLLPRGGDVVAVRALPRALLRRGS